MLFGASFLALSASRRVAAVFFAAALLGLFVAYRALWDDNTAIVPYRPWTQADYGGSWTTEAKTRPGYRPWSLPPTQDGNPKHLQRASEYVASVVSGQHENGEKMECSSLNETRYMTLKSSTSEPSSKRKYFFALDLRQIAPLLPTLMGSIIEAIRFLGPEKCAVSIVEGLSSDGTFEVLKLLQREMDKLGVAYYLQTSDINSHWGDRIGKLSKLRNLALEPMMADVAKWDHDATILFINDVATCTEDILELLYQKIFQGADMTCAMDYHRLYGRPSSRLAFYDVWVSRSMDGNSFFEVPRHGDWKHAWEMFPHDPTANSRFLDRKPFQVFACWNGATTISAAPFLDGLLEFRRAAKHKGECGAGEPTLLCKDMWTLGYGKIMVVPSISLGYDLDEGGYVKKMKGLTSSWTSVEQDSKLPLKIQWVKTPPEMVKCIPSWRIQFWKPWNHGSDMDP